MIISQISISQMIIMPIETIIISAFVTIFSIGLLGVSIASYRRYKNSKLLAVSFVFLIFLIKGILMSLSLFSDEIPDILTSSYSGMFDLIILVLLFIATLRK